MIVADAGPLIAFARIRHLEILKAVADIVLVPPAVYTEATSRDRPGAPRIRESTWIEQQALEQPARIAELPPALGLGEREAIVLAQERHLPLLVDDRRARETAEARGITIVGSLWILKEAKQRGHVFAVQPIVTALTEAGYWIHPERLIEPFLREMGELD